MSWSRRTFFAGLASATAVGCRGWANQTEPPTTSDSAQIRLPSFQEDSLAQGVRLILAEDHSVPLVSVAVLVPAGFLFDPPGEEGTADLAATLLDRGSSAAFTMDRFGALGASLSTQLRPRVLSMSCTVHRSDARAAVRLLTEQLRAPLASPEAFERERNKQHSSLDRLRMDARSVAGLGIVYGSHAVAPVTSLLSSGGPDSIAALTFEEVRAWLQTRLAARGATYLFAGDVTHRDAAASVEAAMSDWSHTGPADVPRASAAVSPERAKIVYVPMPGTRVAHIAFGGRRDALGSPHEVEQRFAEAALHSVLSQELRERRRMTYSVRFHSWSTRRGPVTELSTVVAPHDAGRALSKVYTKVKLTANEGSISADFVDRMAGSRSIGLMDAVAGPEAVLAYLSETVDAELPIDRADQELTRFGGLRRLDVQETYRRLCAPDRTQLCVVADPKTIDEARQAVADADAMERRLDDLIGAPAPRQPPPDNAPSNPPEADQSPDVADPVPVEAVPTDA